jgi:uncharacterized ferritin-like protein (DUF455 family)
LSSRARLLRLDTATALRRFWHLERALIISLGGWVPSVACLETKAALAEAAWRSSLTADELRERVFELRFPDRALARDPDGALVELFEAIANAPSPRAYLDLLASDALPALEQAYRRYLELSDPVADGPSHRFLTLAVQEKREQITAFARASHNETGDERDVPWCEALRGRLRGLGGVPVDAAVNEVGSFGDPGTPHEIPDLPARDPRFAQVRFYWPDNFDPGYPYGEGIRLRLRTAVSHLNEVWAVETAGAILFGLADRLGWAFVRDAARWLYDESRHMTMGLQRLERWGFEASELPLGTFIYGACAGEGIAQRLAMLAFFETKNIGKKAERAVAFGRLGDRDAQRDMEFDWADEAIHAGYGRKWLREAGTAQDGNEVEDWSQLVARCERLVQREIARGTDADRQTTHTLATNLIHKAEHELEGMGGEHE